jgi:tetratricopeptide (TPR) repeat protein
MVIQWIDKYLNEAEQMIYNNQLEQAMTMMHDLLLEEPGYSRLHNHLGWAHLYYTHDLEKAALHFSMAIRFEETYAAPYQHMGNLLMRSGKYLEAIGYFERGLLQNNSNKVALLEGTAQAHELLKDYRNAIKVYKKAMLASVSDQEVNNMTAGIRRCRKKRLVAMFTL